MMKKILILLMIVVAFSCENDNEFPIVSDYDFVSFEDDEVAFALNQDGESTQMLTIYNSRTYSTNRTYNLEVLTESTTITANSYSVPTSVTILANERSAQFEVTINDTGISSGAVLSLGFVDDNTTQSPHPMNLNIVIVCPINELLFDITFDNFAEETSWELYDLNGVSPVLLESGGGYGDLDDQTIQIRLCIGSGEYGFVIYDVYSDGICCNFGSGSYSLTLNGEEFFSGGSFGANQVTSFTAP